MRKFLALIMTSIIVIGTLSPVVFSLDSKDSSLIKISKQNVFAEADSIVFSNLTAKLDKRTGGLFGNIDRDVVVFSFTVNFVKNDNTTDPVLDRNNDMYVALLESTTPNPNLENFVRSDWTTISYENDFVQESGYNIKYNTPINIQETIPVNLSNFSTDKLYAVVVTENETDLGTRDLNGNNFWYDLATFNYDSVNQQIVVQNNITNADGSDPAASAGLECSVWKDGVGDAFFCAIVKIIIYLVNFIPNAIATFSGLLSDFLLKLAINPKIYGVSYEEGAGSFIYGGWKIIRDISNILFIFALFIAAFMLILNKTDIGKTRFDPQKVVVRVIIMALLVNFSLFFCRMIVQTADVFSNILYNQITNTSENKDGAIEQILEKNDIRSASFAIITLVQPQKLFVSAGINTKTPGSYVSYLAVGFLTFFMYLIFISIFVSMSLLWIGRIAGLWLGMILSPIAFVSWSIPFIENNEYIGFEKWLKNFVQLAFMTPIYIFFVYLTAFMLNIPGIKNIYNMTSVSTTDWMVNVLMMLMSTMLPLLIAMFILMQGKKIAYDLSGKIGEMAGKLSGTVSGLALGAATGGSALLARQTLGRAGAALAEKTSEKTGTFGKGLNTFGKKLSTSTYDVRNNKTMMDGFSKATGAAGEKIDLGTKGLQKEGGFAASGGFRQMTQDRRERIQDEEARKREAEALERVNNPQSIENVRLRNAERRKKQAEERKKAEEARIAEEANSAVIDDKGIASLESKTNNSIAENQKELDKVNARVTGKTAMSDNDVEKAKERQKEIEQKMKENKEKLKDVTISTADKNVIKAEQKTLEQEKKDLMSKQKENDSIKKDLAKKEDLENKQAGLQQKLNVIRGSKGKTADQLKHESEIAKLEAQNSNEYKELAKADKEINDRNQEINKLDKEAKELQKEGKVAEASALRDKIKDLRKKNADSKNSGDHKKAKDAFDKKFGNIKALEDTAKDVVKDYTKEQDGRLTDLNTEITNAEIEFKQATYVVQQRRKQILGAHAQALDNATRRNQDLTGNISIDFNQINRVLPNVLRRDFGTANLSEIIGTVSGGRIMGGSVGNTNVNSATNIRTRARTGR